MSLRVEHPAEDVLLLTLNRPERRNAIDLVLLQALQQAMEDPRARAVVLTGAGPTFCAGGDLTLSDAERAALSDGIYALCETMILSPAPIIAAISGHAVGGGAHLAVACDMRIGAPGCVIRSMGPGHGLSVGAWALPSLVGRGRAFDLALTMRQVEAEEALRLGLLDRIGDDPVEAALDMARRFVRLDPGAVARLKMTVTDGLLPRLREEREGNFRAWNGSMAGREG